MLIYPSKCSIFVVCSLLNHRKITATRKKQPLFPAKSESNGGPAVLLEFYGTVFERFWRKEGQNFNQLIWSAIGFMFFSMGILSFSESFSNVYANGYV